MKHMECDICGRKILKQENLTELEDHAKIAGVSEVCHVCLKDINEHYTKLMVSINSLKYSWLQRWIAHFKESKK